MWCLGMNESLFRIRDAIFHEVYSTTRTARAYEALAAFRNLAISLIHLWRGLQVTAGSE